jgi:hypothetical protein
MTIEELISSIENEISDSQDREETARQEIRSMLDNAEQQGRQNLTVHEDARSQSLFRDVDLARASGRRSKARLERARAIQADEERIDRQSQDIRDTGTSPGRTASFTVGRNERTYNPDRDHEAGGKPGSSFLRDAGKAFLGDPLAAERLARHQREELTERPMLERSSVGVGTGAFTGLVVPQYVTELAAPAVAAMRPFADACNHHDLPPDGISVNISKMTTSSSAALQASELAAVSFTDMDDTLLTVPVQTAAGQQLASRQAVERGTLVEEVMVQDLMRRYASVLDSTLINQASTGLAPNGTFQAYTNATVDTTAIPAYWKALIQAGNTIESVMLNQARPSHYIMHPRRWNWVTAAVSSSWPVIAGTNVPPQSWGLQLTNEYGSNVRAVTPNGMKVVVDANISTVSLAQATSGGTQDHTYVIAADESHLWEDPQAPVLLRCEQPSAANLGVLFVLYGYFAYTHARYGASSSVIVSGTGTATPSFA